MSSTSTNPLNTNTTSSSGRKVWEKANYDVAQQTMGTATNVGYLRQNNSRIDIMSTMDTTTQNQYFSFQNLSSSKMQFLLYAGKNANYFRVQVLSQSGQVIADSKSGMGAASKNYTAMSKGTYDLAKGNYYVRVQRTSAAPQNQTLHFTAQISEGSTVKNDYINQISPEPAQLQQEQAVAAVQTIGPELFNAGTFNIFGNAATNLFGTNGYNIFGQKTSAG